MDASRQQNKWLFPVTSTVTFLGFLDTHLLIPVIALYASSLEAGIFMVGLIVGLYSIINTPANIIFGRLIDRTGYKVPLIAGLFGDVLSMVLYAFSRNPLHLALVRVLHGVSGALVAPSTMSVMADNSAREKKGRAMSYYGIALAAASLVGYPLSGIIASRFGYQTLFFFGATAVWIGLLLGLSLPGRSMPEVVRPFPSPGEIVPRLRSLLIRKGLLPSYLSIFVQYFTFGGMVTLLPLHVGGMGMGSFQVGMLLAVFSATFVITQFPSGALSDRFGRQPPVIIGLMCIILALAVLPVLSDFLFIALVMGLYGMGYGILFPSISALITDHTNLGERGLAAGLFHALLTGGVAIGAPVMGWVGNQLGTTTGLLITMLPVLLALVIIITVLRR